jgi:hypothetical protein
MTKMFGEKLKEVTIQFDSLWCAAKAESDWRVGAFYLRLQTIYYSVQSNALK